MSRSGEPTPAVPEVIWLGERSEYVTTDFDGQVRRGTVLGVLTSATPRPGSSATRYLWLRLEPALPIDSAVYDEVVITERHVGTDLGALGTTSISVYVLEPGPATDLERGVFAPSRPGILAWADVALDPAYLPETQETGFDRTFDLVAAFIRRTGRADIASDDTEAGVPIGVWVGNIKSSQVRGHLRADWAARLEALPAWRWYETDEFGLLEAYARREGNTNVPPDHREDDRPLGAWVVFVRTWRSRIPADWIERLEAIEGWHW